MEYYRDSFFIILDIFYVQYDARDKVIQQIYCIE